MALTLREKFDHYAVILSTGFLFGMAITFQYIWSLAFINGGTVRVSVDYFGEQYVELVLLFGVVWPVVLYGTYLTIKRVDAEEWLEAPDDDTDI